MKNKLAFKRSLSLLVVAAALNTANCTPEVKRSGAVAPSGAALATATRVSWYGDTLTKAPPAAAQTLTMVRVAAIPSTTIGTIGAVTSSPSAVCNADQRLTSVAQQPVELNLPSGCDFDLVVEAGQGDAASQSLQAVYLTGNVHVTRDQLVAASVIIAQVLVQPTAAGTAAGFIPSAEVQVPVAPGTVVNPGNPVGPNVAVPPPATPTIPGVAPATPVTADVALLAKGGQATSIGALLTPVAGQAVGTTMVLVIGSSDCNSCITVSRALEQPEYNALNTGDCKLAHAVQGQLDRWSTLLGTAIAPRSFNPGATGGSVDQTLTALGITAKVLPLGVIVRRDPATGQLMRLDDSGAIGMTPDFFNRAKQWCGAR